MPPYEFEAERRRSVDRELGELKVTVEALRGDIQSLRDYMRETVREIYAKQLEHTERDDERFTSLENWRATAVGSIAVVLVVLSWLFYGPGKVLFTLK